MHASISTGSTCLPGAISNSGTPNRPATVLAIPSRRCSILVSILIFKRMKKTFIKILLITLPVVLLTGSCKKYLDVVPDDVATLNSAFANANETQAYLFGCYASLQAL